MLLAAILVLLVPAVGVHGFSTAALTSSTTNALSTVRAAADWTAPVVALQDPGSSVKDTVAITADASDAGSGIASVTTQYAPASSGAWVTICTTTAAPHTCSWNTTSLVDGSYELPARATDQAGYSATSALRSTVVANNLLVVLSSPGDVVRATVSLTTTLHNTGGVSYTVRVEHSAPGAGKWSTVCTTPTAPYTCSWATTGYANGDYDLRAVATSGLTSTPSAVVPAVLVDNQSPTVMMTDPGSPLSGTVTFAATASDAHSGVAQVVLQYAPSASSIFTTMCTLTLAPYSCRFDTTKMPDGAYSLRSVAGDGAGNSTTSTVVTNRVVDNRLSSVSLEDPGTHLHGTVTLTANANAASGVTSVTIQRSGAGTSTWTTVCTVSTVPYGCAWDTTTVADASYDLRAVLLDARGTTTTSTALTARRVENLAARGSDVQAVNGGTVGRVDSGDVITLTYSRQVAPSSITSGWTGTSLPVTLRLRDGGLLNLGTKGDTLDVQRNGVTVNLGSVNLTEDYIRSNRTVTFNATMTATTTTVRGEPVTVVRLTLAAGSTNSSLRTVTTPATMTWTPSATATDTLGRPVSIAVTTETGTNDRDH